MLLFASDLLAKLQNMRYSEGQNLRTHLTQMRELREKLTQLGHPVDDLLFVSNITRSLSESATYESTITSLDAAARISGKPVTLDVLLPSLENKYDQTVMRTEEKKSQEALVAAYNKNQSGSRSGRGGNGSGSRGKSGGNRGGGNPNKGKTCRNCGKKNHVEKDCFAEGGGAAHRAPDWFKELPKEKQKVTKGANVAAQEEQGNTGVALLAANIDDNPTGHYVTVTKC